MNFGKYAILSNARHHFKQEKEWWWEFKPVTAGDEIALLTFIVRGRDIEVDGATKTVSHLNQTIAFREVALAFGGTNIPKKEGAKTPILEVGAPIEEIEAVLKSMPNDMFLEIWTALGETYPFWGPTKQPEAKDGKE